MKIAVRQNVPMLAKLSLCSKVKKEKGEAKTWQDVYIGLNRIPLRHAKINVEEINCFMDRYCYTYFQLQ